MLLSLKKLATELGDEALEQSRAAIAQALICPAECTLHIMECDIRKIDCSSSLLGEEEKGLSDQVRSDIFQHGALQSKLYVLTLKCSSDGWQEAPLHFIQNEVMTSSVLTEVHDGIQARQDEASARREAQQSIEVLCQ